MKKNKIHLGLKAKGLIPLIIGGIITLAAAILCLSYAIQKFGDNTMDYTMIQNLANLTDNQIRIDIISDENFEGVYKGFELHINETDYFDFSTWCGSEQVAKKEKGSLFFAAGYNYDKEQEAFILDPGFYDKENAIRVIDSSYKGGKSGDSVTHLLLTKGSARFNTKVNGKQYCWLTVAEPNTDTPRMILVGQVSSLDSDLSTYLLFIESIILLFISAIIILVVGRINTKTVRRIGLIDEYLKRVARSDYPEEKLVIDTSDELSETAKIINNMVIELMDKQRMQGELNSAANIQLGMLPKNFTSFSDNHMFELYATMQTAKEVGGDFYDFFMVDDTHLAIVMADVSGKGVPAALFMVMGKTVLRSLIRTDSPFSKCMEEINNILCANNENMLFITCWAGMIDFNTGTLVYTNAGHNPPLLMRGDNDYEYLTNLHGIVLGAMDGEEYTEDKIQLTVGDKLFLYTDGITEAQNNGGELFNEERLKACLDKCKSLSPNETLGAVKKCVAEFTDGADQFDDQTMMSIQYIRNSND